MRDYWFILKCYWPTDRGRTRHFKGLEMAFLSQSALVWTIHSPVYLLPSDIYSKRGFTREILSYGLAVGRFLEVNLVIYGRSFTSGNTLITSSLVSVMIPLTWGGLQFSWSSLHVLLPVCIGVVGLIVFFFVEAWVVKEPIVSEVMN